jgi:hypothetical protein
VRLVNCDLTCQVEFYVTTEFTVNDLTLLGAASGAGEVRPVYGGWRAEVHGPDASAARRVALLYARS